MTLAEMRQRRRTSDGVQPPPGRRMTEEEFVAWIGEKTRAEWVDGKVIVMSPVSEEHADLGLWLASAMRLFVEHHEIGKVYGPEYMIRLAKQRRRRLPDVCFVATERFSIVQPNHLEGPPDLAVEVVSPDSVARDWREKYADYEKAGVREYWIVDPLSRKIAAYALPARAKKYRQIEEKDGQIRSTVLPGFFVRARWLFGTPRIKVMSALKETGVTG